MNRRVEHQPAAPLQLKVLQAAETDGDVVCGDAEEGRVEGREERTPRLSTDGGPQKPEALGWESGWTTARWLH